MFGQNGWSGLNFEMVVSDGQTTDLSAQAAIKDDTTLSAIRGLTPRQCEVLAVMMEGKCNKAICRRLNLAEPTVKNHVTAILKALNASNRTEAVVKVARASAMSMSYNYTISGYSASPAAERRASRKPGETA